jgi:hypothetical protein
MDKDTEWVTGRGEWTLDGSYVKLALRLDKGYVAYPLRRCNIIGTPELCDIPDPDQGVKIRYRKK